MVGGIPHAARSGEGDMDERKSETTQESRGVAWPVAGGLALVAVVLRLLRPLPNFGAVGALGLFGGARLGPWLAAALQLGVMVVSDVVLRVFYNLMPFDPFVYASYLIYVLLGQVLCRTNSPWRIGAVCLLGSAQFYLVSNFGVWLTAGIYPRTWEGLVTCYVAGLPFLGRDVVPVLGFFGNTLLSDLLFTTAAFAAYAVWARKGMAAAPSPVTP
jgi:hypothetical protein